jgi:hypothetical protein
VSLSLAAAVAPAWAQHEGHGAAHEHHPSGEEQPPEGQPPEGQPAEAQPAQPPHALDLEAARNGSGTAWQPENTPHAALHVQAAGWELMFHALLFGGYDRQTGARGDQQAMGVGWIMGMARRRVEHGELGLRIMLSPEPWTVRNGGYPLLLQTGETYQGQPLHDRQHPHDLFMELGALYNHELGPGWVLQLYVAPSGEPALGPIAFPHRASAMADPLATLGHHWQDSTHISFGVVTAGVVTRHAKLEGSWFNGREPDETRTNLDLHAPDSYAVRLSVAPSPGVSAQVSYGFLREPEALHPGQHVHRVTASAMVHRPLLAEGHLAALFGFGLNREGDHATPSLLAEANLELDLANVLFGRAELVRKTGHDLVLAPTLDDTAFTVGALSAGYLRNLGSAEAWGGWLPGVGVRGTVNFVPSALQDGYGSRLPLGVIAFVRVAVAPMSHAHHH